MTNPLSNTTVQILGKPYAVRCKDDEVGALQAAAELVHKRMLQVQESGKAINLERIAIITALNIAYEHLQGDQQKATFMQRVNARLNHLQDKLDIAINQSPKMMEFIHSFEQAES